MDSLDLHELQRIAESWIVNENSRKALRATILHVSKENKVILERDCEIDRLKKEIVELKKLGSDLKAKLDAAEEKLKQKDIQIANLKQFSVEDGLRNLDVMNRNSKLNRELADAKKTIETQRQVNREVAEIAKKLEAELKAAKKPMTLEEMALRLNEARFCGATDWTASPKTIGENAADAAAKKKVEPLTISQAIEILNAKLYDKSKLWRDTGAIVISPGDRQMSHFETIAIAEKHLRESSPPPTPEPKPSHETLAIAELNNRVAKIENTLSDVCTWAFKAT